MAPPDPIARLRRALATAERAKGTQHPVTTGTRQKLARAYEVARQPEAAVPLYERAVWDLDQSLGPVHRSTLLARHDLANAYYRSIRLEEALALYEWELGPFTQVFGPWQVSTLRARAGVAACHLQLHRFGEAITEYESLIAGWARVTGPADDEVLKQRHRLACARDGAGQATEAMTQYWQLLGDCERSRGRAYPLTGRLATDLVPPPRPWPRSELLRGSQLWLASLSAISRECAHGVMHFWLYSHAWLNRHDSLVAMASGWGIQSRADLLPMLKGLADPGHRAALAERMGHPPVAWDMGRYAALVRDGFTAEYIDETEAWDLLAEIAAPTVQAYGSWREFADDFLAGRQMWGLGEPGSQQRYRAAAGRLLDPANTRSPWNQVSWRRR